MAEMLIVVAIIIILAAVAFIAVQRYQRSMTQLEYDAIAKEIFIAAQNHLTTAESQGYDGLKSTDYGVPGTSGTDETDKVYYIVSPASPQTESKMLDLMLPFGSIEIPGGSFIIRYQPSSASVLDVFYSNANNATALTVKGIDLVAGDYDTLVESFKGSDKKSDRQSFPGKNGTGIVGWYGDTEALPTGKKLEVPIVIIHNEEKLWAEVTDTNEPETSLILLVTGKTSEAQCKFILRGSSDPSGRVVANQKKVILDDITIADMRFAGIVGQKIPTGSSSATPFIPGEDLYIEAVAFNNKALTNIAYSGKQTTNSLFKSIDLEATAGTDKPIAKIRISAILRIWIRVFQILLRHPAIVKTVLHQ